MADDITTGEMWRRQNDITTEVRTGFKSINERLDKFPTQELLLAHFGTWNAELAAVRKEVTDNKTAHDREIAEVKADAEADRQGTVAARRWAIGTALVGVSVFVGLAGFILTVVSK